MRRTVVLVAPLVVASIVALAALLTSSVTPGARAAVDETCIAIADGLWSDSKTWSGCADGMPYDGADVVISGHDVTLMRMSFLADSSFAAHDVAVTAGGTLTILDGDVGEERAVTSLHAHAITLTHGGGLLGVGDVYSTLSNPSGFVEPLTTTEGTLLIDGTYIQHGGTLKSAVVNAEKHPLDLRGNAALGGTLELAFDPGYEPASDLSHPILTGHHGSHITGAFAAVTRTGGNRYAASGQLTNGPTTCTEDCTFTTLSFPDAPQSVEPRMSRPVVTGNPWPGQTLACSFSQQGYPGASTTIAWWRDDGTSIGTENTTTYAVQNSDVGQEVFCEAQGVTDFSPGGASDPITVSPPPSATTLPRS